MKHKKLSDLTEYLESIENDLRSLNSRFDDINLDELEDSDDDKQEILSRISSEEIKNIFDIFSVVSDNLKNIDIDKELKNFKK